MFAYRLRLFELFGFKVSVDPSWLLLAILIIWSLAVGYFPAVAPGLESATYWWMGLAGLIGLGLSIVVHELAHSLVARRFDMPIHGITLFIFGGVAEMTEEPRSPKGEALMAIAGPLMSVAAAVVFWLISGLLAAGQIAYPAVIVSGYLAFLNMLLAVFNLVPAFPLDGGRILRAALWGWKGDLVWATRKAAGAGSLFGLFLILLGLFNVVTGNFVGGLWWFLIGLFVRSAAANTLQQQLMRLALSGQPVRRFMRSEPVTVPPDLPLDRLVDGYVFTHFHKTFPVAENGRLVGCVTMDAVRRADRDQWPVRTVGSVMDRCDDITIAPDADATQALERMRRSGRSRLMVVDGGRLTGVIALRDLLDYLSLKMDLGADEGMRRAS